MVPVKSPTVLCFFRMKTKEQSLVQIQLLAWFLKKDSKTDFVTMI